MARPANPRSARCSTCGRRFRDAMKMGAHVRRAHLKPGQEPPRDARTPAPQLPPPFPAFVMTGDNNRITTRS